MPLNSKLFIIIIIHFFNPSKHFQNPATRVTVFYNILYINTIQYSTWIIEYKLYLGICWGLPYHHPLGRFPSSRWKVSFSLTGFTFYKSLRRFLILLLDPFRSSLYFSLFKIALPKSSKINQKIWRARRSVHHQQNTDS